MIEEAAGTKLYESKKEAAQKTIEKKDAKLKEIDSVSIVRLTSKNLPRFSVSFATVERFLHIAI